MSSMSDVLDFWLGPEEARDAPAREYQQLWFMKNPQFDDELKARFGMLLGQAASGELDAWAATPRGKLALIIVLDQFSRNIDRDRPGMFSNDEKALDLAHNAIDHGEDRALKFAERQFLYMPLMHAEDLQSQERCVALFEQLAEADERYKLNLDFAIRHRDIVARFGRFPHRNGILGRTCTAEELEFLRRPGTSF